MKSVFDLCQQIDPPFVVVLSAVSGTTNSLLEIAENIYKRAFADAKTKIDQLQKSYEPFIEELFESIEYRNKAHSIIKPHFDYVRSFALDMFTPLEERAVLSVGELISTQLFALYTESQNRAYCLVPALEMMRLGTDNEPDFKEIKARVSKYISKTATTPCVTQGFICRDAFGEVANLKRGGSDYTASILGAVLDASEIQIWTDIDGMHNNDPRVVPHTKPIRRLSFDEAAELAYFGAKILHPSSILPAKLANIPVRLKNTLDPEAPGTLISADHDSKGIIAIAAKDGISALGVKSGRMLLAYGFLRRVFEVFESYKTPIDMITTSEVAVSVTIDDPSHLEAISNDLKAFGSVEVERDLTIICIVGNFIAESKGYASKIFHALDTVPIRMISFGGSVHNISIAIRTEHKARALQLLHLHLF